MSQAQHHRRPTRRDRLLKTRHHDPYWSGEKLRDPTVCADCTAVFRDGRWKWAAPPADALRARCPACRRIADDYPAGFVRIEGTFARTHLRDIVGLLRNTEEREREEHPLKRIMDLRIEGPGLVVRTTDLHLARDLGKALESAYEGRLTLDYAEDLVRVMWER